MNPPEPDEMGRELRHPTEAGAEWVTAFMERNNHSMYELTWNCLAVPPGGTILEIACANGAFIDRFLKRFPDSLYYGLDGSIPMIHIARTQLATLLQKGNVVIDHGFSDKLPYKDLQFDRAYSVNHLYFLKEPLEDLIEMHRILCEGGKTALTIRSRSGMERLPFTKIGFRLFEPEEVEILLKKAGFHTISVHQSTETIKMIRSLEEIEMSNYCITGIK